MNRDDERRSGSPRDDEQPNGERDSLSRSRSGSPPRRQSESPERKEEEMRSRSPSAEAVNDVDE